MAETSASPALSDLLDQLAAAIAGIERDLDSEDWDRATLAKAEIDKLLGALAASLAADPAVSAETKAAALQLAARINPVADALARRCAALLENLQAARNSDRLGRAYASSPKP